VTRSTLSFAFPVASLRKPWASRGHFASPTAPPMSRALIRLFVSHSLSDPPAAATPPGNRQSNPMLSCHPCSELLDCRIEVSPPPPSASLPLCVSLPRPFSPWSALQRVYFAHHNESIFYVSMLQKPLPGMRDLLQRLADSGWARRPLHRASPSRMGRRRVGILSRRSSYSPSVNPPASAALAAAATDPKGFRESRLEPRRIDAERALTGTINGPTKNP
jgi:hypothetical protein